MALWADTLFWTQINLDNSIRFRRTDGSDVGSLLACGQEWPDSLVAEADAVFWMNEDIYDRVGRIMRVGRDGGAPKVLLEGLQSPVRSSLAGDATTLYWLENGTSIKRMRWRGCHPHPSPQIVVDGSIGELSPFHDTFGYYAQGVRRFVRAAIRQGLVRREALLERLATTPLDDARRERLAKLVAADFDTVTAADREQADAVVRVFPALAPVVDPGWHSGTCRAQLNRGGVGFSQWHVRCSGHRNGASGSNGTR